ncbi:MAG TPA: gliding motility lipoprotein GldH [Flavobacteriales bacterium]|nr:gliding motility lipoprotein GldH [Flavobacteriales bacterium]
MKLSDGILIFVLVFISCDNNIVFDDYKTFENQTWSADSSVIFSYSVIDTTSQNQLVIKVRHTTNYMFQNLFLFVKTEKTDTLELLLANKEGEWLGNGIGDVREVELVYRKDKVFAKKEDFTFEMEQAMRYGQFEKIQHLNNIKAIGLSIQKQND